MGERLAFTFALTGRSSGFYVTQGVALGSELTALSGRSRRNHKYFSLRVRGPHFASKVSYSAGAATDDCAGLVQINNVRKLFSNS